MSLLLRAGADERRMIDGQGWPIERFAAHVARLKALRAAGARAMVVLTQTNPIALAVLQARRVLEEAVPKLATAPWLIIHDPSADPFFADAAARLGAFDTELELGPIWHAPHGHRFLVLSSHPALLEYVAGRLAALELELA